MRLQLIFTNQTIIGTSLHRGRLDFLPSLIFEGRLFYSHFKKEKIVFTQIYSHNTLWGFELMTSQPLGF